MALGIVARVLERFESLRCDAKREPNPEGSIFILGGGLGRATLFGIRGDEAILCRASGPLWRDPLNRVHNLPTIYIRVILGPKWAVKEIVIPSKKGAVGYKLLRTMAWQSRKQIYLVHLHPDRGVLWMEDEGQIMKGRTLYVGPDFGRAFEAAYHIVRDHVRGLIIL